MVDWPTAGHAHVDLPTYPFDHTRYWPEITTARTDNGTFHIVRVLVVGIFTEAGFRTAIPTALFSFERVDERVA